jgi:hypothetical protein
MQHTPNLVLHPGPGNATEESMVRELDHGVHVAANLNLTVDWMCANAYSFTAVATEIRRGTPVRTFRICALIFRSDQFWKNVDALGGAKSAAYMGSEAFPRLESRKGDPKQATQYSVGAVPARVKQIAVVNPWNKA